MPAAYTRGSAVCAVLLAGCFGLQAGELSDEPDEAWIPGLPITNSFAGVVDLASEPSGAEVTTSLGGGCRTPCSLEVSAEAPFTATFTLDGYASTTVQVKIQRARMGVSNRKFAPNPVFAQLDPVAKPVPPQTAPKKAVATARPQQAVPRKPATVAQPAAPPAPVKPTAGVNAGPIVPADPARSSDSPVAQRWLENFDKMQGKKTGACRGC